MITGSTWTIRKGSRERLKEHRGGGWAEENLHMPEQPRVWEILGLQKMWPSFCAFNLLNMLLMPDGTKQWTLRRSRTFVVFIVASLKYHSFHPIQVIQLLFLFYTVRIISFTYQIESWQSISVVYFCILVLLTDDVKRKKNTGQWKGSINSNIETRMGGGTSRYMDFIFLF